MRPSTHAARIIRSNERQLTGLRPLAIRTLAPALFRRSHGEAMSGIGSESRLRAIRDGRRAVVRGVVRAKTLARMRAHQVVELARGGARPVAAASVPVVIHNRDRLGHLRRQVGWLEACGFENILILDNGSTSRPLLEWYEKTRHEVIHLGEDLGRYALWKHPVFERVRRGYYIYTDSDVVACDACPPDFLDFFFETLARFAWSEKVGFALRIDDLPTHIAQVAVVRERESVHWTRPYSQHLYDASIDTSFALYRPFAMGGHWCRALRTAGPYQARCLTWYEDPEGQAKRLTGS